MTSLRVSCADSPLHLPNGVVPSLAGITRSLQRNPSTSTTASSAASSADVESQTSSRRALSVSSAAAHRKDSSSSLRPHDLAHGHNAHLNNTHVYSPYSNPHSLPRSAPLTRSPSNASSAPSRHVFDVNNQPVVLNTHHTGLDTPPNLTRNGERMFELPPLLGEQNFTLPPVALSEARVSDVQPELTEPPEWLPVNDAGPSGFKVEPVESYLPHSAPPEPEGWRLDTANNAEAEFDLSAEIDRWRQVLELEFDPELAATALSQTPGSVPPPPPLSSESSSANSSGFRQHDWIMPSFDESYQQAQASPSLFEPDFPPSASAFEYHRDVPEHYDDGAFYSGSASSSSSIRGAPSSAAGSEYSFSLEHGSAQGEYNSTLSLSFADFDLSLGGTTSGPQIVDPPSRSVSHSEDDDEDDDERQIVRRTGPTGDSRLALDREETWRPGRRTPDG